MPLSTTELTTIKRAARLLSPATAPMRVEAFCSRALNLNAAQSAQYFPNPDPAGSLEITIGYLTGQREEMLRDQSIIPSYVIYQDGGGANFIAGFDEYLAYKNVDNVLRRRLQQHSLVRAALRRIQNGHDLEALAAAIMNEQCDYGEATRGSGDQGIDAIGWSELILVDQLFADGALGEDLPLPGDKVFLFASSKAFTGGGNGPPSLISPAHIRELVGGWVIQRSSTGMWQKVGIRMLSPVQMILVTTYRLSEDAKAECRALGVQIWSIPELIYLICRAAPASVFNALNNHAFLRTEFTAWWRQRNATRMMAA